MLRVLKAFLLGLLVLINPISALIFGFVKETDLLVPWESLGTPPQKAVAILGANVRETGVFVKTATGEIYQWGFGAKDTGWWLADARDVKGYNFLDCLMGGQDKGKHLRGEVANYAVYWCGEWDYGRAYYVIQSDGSVWVWKHAGNSMVLMIEFCGYPLLALFIIPIIGAALYVVATRQSSGRTSGSDTGGQREDGGGGLGCADAIS